jgi:hemerythrin-like domain-containing protein
VPVTPAEDLYREHAVLRGLLLVFDELTACVARGCLDPRVALRAAMLFERFGAKYHAKSEEKFIFPLFASTAYGPLVSHLKREHKVADAFVGKIKSYARSGSIPKLRRVIPRFTMFYRGHADIEDIDLFANLHNVLSLREERAVRRRMELFERQALGRHGFDETVEELRWIQSLP